MRPPNCLTGKSGQSVAFFVQPHQKKFPLRALPKSNLELPPSRSSGGALAIVTDVERDAVDADGADDERRLRRTAKSCGPDASTLALSLAEASAR